MHGWVIEGWAVWAYFGFSGIVLGKSLVSIGKWGNWPALTLAGLIIDPLGLIAVFVGLIGYAVWR